MKNNIEFIKRRTGIIVGEFARSYPNYHRRADEGFFFTAGIIDVTLPSDKCVMRMNFKAHAAAAEFIIENVKNGDIVYIEAQIDEEHKDQKNKQYGHRPVLVLSESSKTKIIIKHKNGDKVYFN